MKAMTCPQCGALIKKISLKNEFADCDYCEAKILIAENKDKIVEFTDKKLSAWEQYRENHRQINERTKQYDSDYTHLEEPKAGNSLVGTVVVFLVIGFIAIGGFIAIIASISSRPSDLTKKTQPRPIASPLVIPTIAYPTATPLPEINYQVNVEWSGANDMEHFENPQIDSSKLPSRNYAELKKTVFKNRAAQVKVTINTDGEVTQAEAISGHPILKEAAVEAAKKTLFNSRSKPTTRILTYYFRLIDE